MTFIETIAANTPLLLATGIAGLLIGAYAVSQGASLMMHRWTISPTLIGLFLSFAATLPELAVTAQALGPRIFVDLAADKAVYQALKGAQLPIGLILGSTLINLMVLTAVGALFLSMFQGRKLFITKRALGRDLLTLLIAIGVILWFSFGASNEMTEGLLNDRRDYYVRLASFLLIGAGAYVIIGSLIEFIIGAVETDDSLFDRADSGSGNILLLGFLIIGGCAILYGSSLLLVEKIDDFVSFVYGTDVAAGTGVISEADREDYTRFGLFVVAFGVAAPELIMMLANVLRRDAASISLTIGTLIGAAIFNLLLVLGMALMAIAQGDLIHVFNITPFKWDFFFVGAGVLALALFLINDLWDREEQGILSVREAMTLVALYALYAFYRHDYFQNGYAAACNASNFIGTACRGVSGVWQSIF